MAAIPVTRLARRLRFASRCSCFSRQSSKKVEARKKAAEAKRSKQEETRRKVLVRAVVLAKMKDGSYPEAEFNAMIDAALSRAEDHKLFGLQVVEDAKQTGTTPDTKPVQKQIGDEQM